MALELLAQGFLNGDGASILAGGPPEVQIIQLHWEITQLMEIEGLGRDHPKVKLLELRIRAISEQIRVLEPKEGIANREEQNDELERLVDTLLIQLTTQIEINEQHIALLEEKKVEATQKAQRLASVVIQNSNLIANIKDTEKLLDAVVDKLRKLELVDKLRELVLSGSKK